MKTRILIIVGISITVFLLTAVVYPTINYKTWGNNELHYTPFSVGTKIVCDEWLWQPPQNCRHVSTVTDTNRDSEIIQEDAQLQEPSASSVSINPPSGMNKDEREQLQIKKILEHCNIEGVKINILYRFSNSTHYIDSNICEWQKDSMLIDILDRCDQVKKTGSFGGFAYGSSWQNQTHHIDTMDCKWREIENEN